MVFEEDGAIVSEPICKHALPLIADGCEDIWCSLKGIICYKVLDEQCMDEELITPSV
jgi:hypothetical protein